MERERLVEIPRLPGCPSELKQEQETESGGGGEEGGDEVLDVAERAEEGAAPGDEHDKE